MKNVLAAWLLAAVAVASPATGPRETVETAVARVVEALQQADGLGPARGDRIVEVKRIAAELFDFDEVARRALARHWAARTPRERTEFVELFTGLLEHSYASRIEAYAGERVVYTGEVIDGPYAIVRSRMTTRQSEVGIDYRMHWRDGRWRVYDVVVDGVSFVSTFRSQFDRVIQAESYNALLERLRKRSFDTAIANRKRP